MNESWLGFGSLVQLRPDPFLAETEAALSELRCLAEEIEAAQKADNER